MASAASNARELPARYVIALSDAELDQYLEEHRGANGETTIDGRGWETVPKDEQDRFIQRLRDRMQNERDAQSRPVDLDQVSARLLGLSALPPTRTRPELSHDERSSTGDPPGPDHWREEERVSHNALVSDGGRPWYPISLLDEVSEDPAKYSDMLFIWRKWNPKWMVFGQQLRRWKDFRTWQRDNRGILDLEGEFAAEVDRRKRFYAETGYHETVSHLEDKAELEKEFDSWQVERKARARRFREAQGHGRYHDYVEAVRRRLSRHNFTRTFQLEEDPKCQDRLTTWIEYLNYEYWWYDSYVPAAKRLQQRYDAAWKELVDSKVLRPSETEEVISGERDAAERTVRSAMSAIERAKNDTQQSSLTPEQRSKRLTEAQSGLDAAKKCLESVKERNKHIFSFSNVARDYGNAKERVDHHEILLRWILEQIPLIELELNESKRIQGGSDESKEIENGPEESRGTHGGSDESKESEGGSEEPKTAEGGSEEPKTTEGGSDAARGRKRRLQRDQDVITAKEQNPKKRKTDNQSPLLASPAQTKTRSRRSRHDDAACEKIPLRRSARIAARREASGNPPPAVNSQKRQRKAAPVATQPSPPAPRKRKLTSAATKERKDVSQADKSKPQGISKRGRPKKGRR
ncbi:hypothetical protein QBC46DRAFT_449292 [Diplogelasinospora grovesii]|uniref:Uncharacterized protein n=1 Tax=Diplogelasinospora grovesii TaxID=303347 RepID=A0AAN6N7U7_9PEZI|nr:hypothetical protein QBC46DRAFT_449292 [Diplogelasinospora grovesii]